MLTVQGTASETVLVALLAAQARAMASRPAEDRQRLVCYSSDQVCILFSERTVTCILVTISATGRSMRSSYARESCKLELLAFSGLSAKRAVPLQHH